MKKIITIILAMLLIATLVACDSHNTATTPTTIPSDTTASTPVEEIDIPESFRKVPAKEEMLEAYRNEVKYRCSQEKYFTENEKLYIESLGYGTGNGVIREWNALYSELYEYYYPVVYKVEDEVLIVYSVGCLAFESQNYSTQSKAYMFAYVHTPEPTEEDEILANKVGYGAIYNQNTGSVSFWEFGEKTVECSVPKGAVYVGYSDWEGFLFRDGTIVYAVPEYCLPGSDNQTATAKVIANNVKEVLLANYAAGSDDWSQPLFLMTDGTIKVYCSWYGDSKAPADDPCHLEDIRYEGGYDRNP